MSNQEDASPAAPPVIESGMRTGQGDDSDDADTLTIGEKYENDAPNPASDPEGAADAVHDAAIALGDLDYDVRPGR